MKNLSNITLIGYFLACFVVFYIQPINFGPLKGSILTQFFLFAFLLNQLFKAKRRDTDNVGKLSIWVALKVVFSPNLFSYLGATLVDFFKFSLFPLFYHYFKNCVSNIRQIENIIKFMSAFVVASGIPFLLNILKPVSEGYKLDIFGEEGSYGFVGLFQNSHSASIVTGLALINLLFFVNKGVEKKYEKFFIFLIIVGLIIIYKTYVRTGYLVLIVGFITIFIKQIKFKYIGRYLALILCGFVVLIFVYNNDATLRNRIEDNYEYKSGSQKSDLGSGRVLFQIAAFDIWSTSSIPEVLFGTGVEKLTEEMEKRVSLKIHTHNGFTDALVKDGLIGFCLFISFLIAMFRRILGSNNNPYKLLSLATFNAYFFFQLVQGGVISPMIEVFLVLNLALLNFKLKPKIELKSDSALATT